jgi:hypothetical protein
MGAFSYVSGLTSVILALGIARLLIGVGKLLEKRSQVIVLGSPNVGSKHFPFHSTRMVGTVQVANPINLVILPFHILTGQPNNRLPSLHHVFPCPLPASIDFKEHY